MHGLHGKSFATQMKFSFLRKHRQALAPKRPTDGRSSATDMCSSPVSTPIIAAHFSISAPACFRLVRPALIAGLCTVPSLIVWAKGISALSRISTA